VRRMDSFLGGVVHGREKIREKQSALVDFVYHERIENDFRCPKEKNGERAGNFEKQKNRDLQKNCFC